MEKLLISIILLFPVFLSAADADRARQSDFRLSVSVDGTEREAFVHLPPSYQNSTASPLVLVFHGGLRDAQSTIRYVGMNELSDREGFIVVYPQGLPLPHSPSRRHRFWNSSQSKFTTDADDVHFTEVLIARLKSTLSVDPERVFATGVSNGAHMAYRLACRLSSQIAAIAPVAGSLETDPCRPDHPVSVIDFHGTEDQFLPYDGGGKMGFHSVPYTIQSWVGLDACSPAPTISHVPVTVDDGTSVSIREYSPCAQQSSVTSVVIEGGGHNWPGIALEEYPFLFGQRVIGHYNWSVQKRKLGKVTMQISFKEMMWEFFEGHPMSR